MKHYYIYLLIVLLTACKKNWLDIRSNKSIVTPSEIEDYMALLNNQQIINAGTYRIQDLAEIGTDNYYMADEIFAALTDYTKPAYIFGKDIWEGAENVPQWNGPYKRIFYANVVLDGLKKMEVNDNNRLVWEMALGNALFLRAYTYFWLMQVYAAPYHPESAALLPGVPLRLSSDVNPISKRARIKECYNQIIKDIDEAIPLLDEKGANPIRASKETGYALLARVYLLLDNMEAAAENARLALMVSSNLLNYNELNMNLTYPVTQYNSEVIYSDLYGSIAFAVSRGRVDTLLYQQYQNNDLRRTAYFKKQTTGYYSFNGSYNGTSAFFCGIARDEVFLIYAEALARLGKPDMALNALNQLLKTRWATNDFVPYNTTNQPELISLILAERRKSLLFRGLRWYDLRRLNSLYAAGIKVTRKINGKTYVLEPNSAKYIMPIPDDIIALSAIEQNIRD